MKIINKIIIAIIAVLILICTYIPSNAKAVTMKSIIEGGDIFTQSASNTELFNETNQKSAVDGIYYILLGVGIVLAVIIGIVLGIQFVTTGVAGQAKIKEKLIPYAIGCIVIFGGFGIWRAVINMSSNVLNTTEKVNIQYDNDQVIDQQDVINSKQQPIQQTTEDLLQPLPKSNKKTTDETIDPQDIINQ